MRVEARGNESSAAIRRELTDLLRSSGDEFAEMFVTRIRNSELGANLDATGLAAVHLAAAEMVEAVRSQVEEGEHWSGNLPPGVLSSIQYSTREGMPLEDVLRGFATVGTTLFEFLSRHFDELSQPENVLRYLATVRSRNEDRIMATLAAEYEREKARLESAPTRRLADRIEGLLARGSEDFAGLDYRFDGHHLGLIARGRSAALACRRLAELAGCELLLLPKSEDTFWAWLGSPREIAVASLLETPLHSGGDLTISVGESQGGLDGWRTTHREARAAFAVALLGQPGITRYSDVALLAAAHSSEVTGRALLSRYLEPLGTRRNGDELRSTLRAYLDTGCNAVSAAATLGVDRHTVQRRLRRIEEAVGEPPATRQAEFDIALRLEQLTATMKSLAAAAPVSQEVPTVLPSRAKLAHPEGGSR